MEKLKVALVIPTHTNMNSSLHNLLKAYEHIIKRHPVQVTVFVDEKYDFRRDGFNVEKIKGLDHGTLIEKMFLVIGLQRNYYKDIVEKLKGFDVIETSNPEFYWFAYQSYIAAKKYGIRLVLRTSQTVEGFYMFKFTKIIPLSISKKAYRFAKWLLFSNPEAKARCERLGLVERNSRKSVVIGHATDTKVFHPMNIKKEKKIILSVGGLYKLKGHDLIIAALKKVIDSGIDCELWIVGSGYYQKNLEKLAKNLGISSKVKFLGSKNHNDLSVIYNKASVFVLANNQEITPAVNEAYSCEVPVVAMDCGGARFVIKDDSYGIITKKNDIDDLARGIKKMLTDKAYAISSSKKGRRHVLTNFSVEKVGEKIYRSFID